MVMTPNNQGNFFKIDFRYNNSPEKGFLSVDQTPRKKLKGFLKVKNISSLFNFGEVIGEGSFGKVRLAMNR